jgi:hypothetical protein
LVSLTSGGKKETNSHTLKGGEALKKLFLTALGAAVLICQAWTAQAKTEFELGGFIRLIAVWNTQQSITHTLAALSWRGNVLNANHGRFMVTASNSRFNFTIKGPELWGGKVVGFIEVDFEGIDSINAGTLGTSVNDSSYNQAKLRLRHAMFKIIWPQREILFGQYWSMNSEMIPDVAHTSGYCLYGSTLFRVPQVRYTQKFTDAWDASLAILASQNGRWGLNIDSTNPLEGETSETPMVEAKVRFEQDLYGKAAWYGKPRGFYVGLGAGYYRTRNNPATFVNTTATQTWRTLGQDNYNNLAAALTMTVNEMKYQDHWLFMIENFTPVIPTVTQNLAGSLGLAHQWWIGQGVSAWRLDLPSADRFYVFNGNVNNNAAAPGYDLSFLKRYGGWAQLQYYFTNEIFTNLNFGFEKAFGFNNARNINAPGGFLYGAPNGFDPINSTWRAGVSQWYRPVAAVKFGLQYSYMRTNYFQNTTVGSNTTNYGNNHSLMANAWYMF